MCAAVLAMMVISGQGRELMDNGADCSAYSSIELIVEGGSCSGRGKATCSSVSSSQSQYREAFKEWFGSDYEGNACNSGKAEAAAEAIAKAIAEVYTSSYTDVKCSKDAGGSSACGWSQGNGEAWAASTADAVANALADAGDKGGKGLCLSDIRAVSAVIAKATASSLTDGCAGAGESTYIFRETHKKSIQTGYAKAFAKATAYACRNGFEASAGAECEGDSESVVDSFVSPPDTPSSGGSGSSSGNGGSASGGGVPHCVKGVRSKCCDPSHDSYICLCDPRNGCQDGIYSRTIDVTDNQLRIWEAPNGENCVCVL